ncbi:MAG: Holliday junction resolvase RuvX [Kiritimatiellae bacterium]|nr:Holliday junction resolvase RuvX [Kiritimatiellia bacterium]
MGKILGVDFGDRRTGLAVSDESELIAFPRETLECPLLQQAAAAVARAAEAVGAVRIVVGYPLRLDGSPGPRADRTNEFIAELSRRTPLPVERWDERLSTCEVERVLLAADVSRARRKGVVDKLAAQVILQSYLDAHTPAPSAFDDDDYTDEEAP